MEVFLHPVFASSNRARFLDHQNSPISVEDKAFLALFLPTQNGEDPKKDKLERKLCGSGRS